MDIAVIGEGPGSDEFRERVVPQLNECCKQGSIFAALDGLPDGSLTLASSWRAKDVMGVPGRSNFVRARR